MKNWSLRLERGMKYALRSLTLRNRLQSFRVERSQINQTRKELNIFSYGDYLTLKGCIASATNSYRRQLFLLKRGIIEKPMRMFSDDSTSSSLTSCQYSIYYF